MSLLKVAWGGSIRACSGVSDSDRRRATIDQAGELDGKAGALARLTPSGMPPVPAFAAALCGGPPQLSAPRLAHLLRASAPAALGLSVLPATGSAASSPADAAIGNPASPCLTRCRVVLVACKRGSAAAVAFALLQALRRLGCDPIWTRLVIGPLETSYASMQGPWPLDAPSTDAGGTPARAGSVVTRFASFPPRDTELTLAIEAASATTSHEARALVGSASEVLRSEASRGWASLGLPMRLAPAPTARCGVAHGAPTSGERPAPGSGQDPARAYCRGPSRLLAGWLAVRLPERSPGRSLHGAGLECALVRVQPRDEDQGATTATYRPLCLRAAPTDSADAEDDGGLSVLLPGGVACVTASHGAPKGCVSGGDVPERPQRPPESWSTWAEALSGCTPGMAPARFSEWLGPACAGGSVLVDFPGAVRPFRREWVPAALLAASLAPVVSASRRLHQQSEASKDRGDLTLLAPWNAGMGASAMIARECAPFLVCMSGSGSSAARDDIDDPSHPLFGQDAAAVNRTRHEARVRRRQRSREAAPARVKAATGLFLTASGRPAKDITSAATAPCPPTSGLVARPAAASKAARKSRPPTKPKPSTAVAPPLPAGLEVSSLAAPSASKRKPKRARAAPSTPASRPVPKQLASGKRPPTSIATAAGHRAHAAAGGSGSAAVAVAHTAATTAAQRTPPSRALTTPPVSDSDDSLDLSDDDSD